MIKTLQRLDVIYPYLKLLNIPINKDNDIVHPYRNTGNLFIVVKFFNTTTLIVNAF